MAKHMAPLTVPTYDNARGGVANVRLCTLPRPRRSRRRPFDLLRASAAARVQARE